MENRRYCVTRRQLLWHVVTAPLLACLVLLIPGFFWYLSGFHDWKMLLTFCAVATAFAVVMAQNVTQLVLSLEITPDALHIRTPFRQHVVPFSTLIAISPPDARGYFELFSVTHRAPLPFALYLFSLPNRQRMATEMASALAVNLAARSAQDNAALRNVYQYDVEKTEAHHPVYVFFAALLTVQVSLLLLILVLLACVAEVGEIFEVVEPWYIATVFTQAILLTLFDRLSGKRTLRCEAGVLSLFKDGREVKRLNLWETRSISVGRSPSRQIRWSNPVKPGKTDSLSLLGFSRTDKREIVRNMMFIKAIIQSQKA